MKQTLLFLVFFIGYFMGNSQCTAPTALTVSAVTETSATFAWTATGTATSWEVIALSMGSPAPSNTTNGIVSNTTTFTYTNLECGYPYVLYVRSVCGSGENSTWAGPMNFDTMGCGSSCFPPTEVHIQQQTSNSTTVMAYPTSSPEVEFLLRLSFAPPPTPNDAPTASSSTFPFTMPLAECSNVSLWYRNACSSLIMWEGPIALRPINMAAQLNPIYGCVDSDVALFDYSDLVPQLPAGDIQIYSSLLNLINSSATGVYGTDYTFALPLQYGTQTHYAVVNLSGCDTVYPFQIIVGDGCEGFRLESFLDENSNGTKDAGEVNFPVGHFNYSVNDGEALYGYSQTGTYFVYEENPANSYDFSYNIDAAYQSDYSVLQTYTDVSNTDGITVLYFPVTANSAFADASVNLVALANPMPGFTVSERIEITNKGSVTIASGVLTYVKDAAIASVTVPNQSVTTTPTGFTMSFANLLPFETRAFDVVYTVPTIPTVTLGQQLHASASISVAADAVSANNQSVLNQTIIGSYDPNDKMEAHGPQIVHSTFSANDYLYYTIRFENTGTAAAHDIRIEDVLDSQLNQNSVELLSSSAHCTLTRNGNGLVFNFPNVMLAPSVEGTQIGHGYVQFRVKPNAGFQTNDVIPNQAEIYFDFNPAIVTNEWTTTFVTQLQVDESQIVSASVYPNPVNDIVFIQLTNGNVKSAKVYDVSGKIVGESQFSNQIDLSEAQSGLYLLDIVTDSNLKFTRKIVKK
ncbi:T9SS type A sorting domain-containing protein [Flavobacterium sp.]|uniref:T9SS type A sorting domain-containing protein n=1 Tax=Flavobacterium sp. TaxID=239 RepID=UPI0011F51232|nr:T9SS type A sorting domain-containing protein [Flavobacterium sp.]RZJ69105.1 MAG: T9SS type A sorting domain-containing protein [Flavobacterium sp.]